MATHATQVNVARRAACLCQTLLMVWPRPSVNARVDSITWSPAPPSLASANTGEVGVDLRLRHSGETQELDAHPQIIGARARYDFA